MSALDNPAYSSLRTTHRRFAVQHGDVIRFAPEVAPFLAIAEPGPVDALTLETLVTEEVAYFLGPRPALPTGWVLEDLGAILQMICDAPVPVPATSASDPSIDALDERDRPAILELTRLVYPHYFRPRTPELGRYHGIRGAGRLDAITGERMAMPGFREISAVCTHPDCVGRGLARRLLAHGGNAIFADGETPFLHVSPKNTRAVQLYEQNGYRHRIDVPFWSVRRLAVQS